LGESPAGNPQWFPEGGPGIIMLTTDIALRDDPGYNPITQEFADDITSLEDAFVKSWYQLVTNDMGSRERCLNDDAPESQPWQYGLPAAPSTLPDFVPIREALQAKIDADDSNLGAFVKLAMGCANTFRETDYRGGCNGARVRFEPELNWSTNDGAAATLTMIEAIKAEYPNASYADLIVLAGQTALEAAGLPAVDFCGGRVDAEDAGGSNVLAPRVYATGYLTITDDWAVKGLSTREGVALRAAPKPGSQTLSNQFFVDLKAGNGDFSEEDKALLEGDMAAIIDEYIGDNDVFLGEFAGAFTQMMVADRFDGPVNNACENVKTPTLGDDEVTPPDDGESEDGESEDDEVTPPDDGESAAAGYFMSAAAIIVAAASFMAL
jgi:catalase-peroxidase